MYRLAVNSDLSSPSSAAAGSHANPLCLKPHRESDSECERERQIQRETERERERDRESESERTEALIFRCFDFYIF